jgi:hypothetical protein
VALQRRQGADQPRLFRKVLNVGRRSGRWPRGGEGTRRR